MNELIDRAVGYLREARSVLFITGAGMSADSGLPTYRGVGGLYNSGQTEEGLPIEVLLSGQVFRTRPHLTWKYLSQIEQACRAATCNRGHRVLAEMEGHFERVWVLTQNVDGFHRLAGSKNVIDIHGDIRELMCTQCPYRETVADYSQLTFPPRCPDCAGLLRPDVVLFDEMLPARQLTTLYDQLDEGFDLVFSIGTTSVFPYIAEPIERAHREGKPSVEINPERTDVSDLATLRLPLRAAAALNAIWWRYQGKPGSDELSTSGHDI
jgi:NAD-dependent deacetylase